MSLQTRITDLAIRVATEFKSVKSTISGNTSGSLTGLLTTIKTSILAAINELKTRIDTKQDIIPYVTENVSEKGNPNGYASLDGTGKVPAAQLPAFVDDVLDFPNLAAFPAVGVSSILYVAEDTNIVYRWSGANYVATNGALALGETSSSAYRGDRGKIAFDHSLITSGNPHGVSFDTLVGKPTTIAGYGITDAHTKTEIGDPTTNLVAIFETSLI